MLSIGEAILQTLIRWRRQPAACPAAVSAEEEAERYFRWQYTSSEALFQLYPNWSIKDKSVLEIGCGMGGRAAYLAAAGAKRVVAIDINAEEIASARDLGPRLYPASAGRVEYLVSEEASRLDIGTFDVVLLIDCMEHVVSPPQMMRLAHQYTAPGGQCFFSCFGYYHPSGAHVGMLPFINVFFSDETIVNTIRWHVSRPDYVPSRFDSDPPLERWRGIYDLRDRPGEHLNKLTLRDIRKLVRYSIFPSARMTVIPPGRNSRWLRWLGFLSQVPLIQEVFHSYVVVECRR